MRSRLLAALLGSLLLFALCVAAYPDYGVPDTARPYPATMEGAAREFVVAVMCEGLLSGIGGGDENAGRYVAAKSSPLVEGLEDYLLPALLFGRVSVRQVETRGARGTVAANPGGGAVNIELVQEDGKWKVDLLATFEGLPEPWRPNMDEVRKKVAENAEFGDLSDLKQLAVGLIMYAAEHEGHLPTADRWMDAIWPYVKNEAIFRSPSAPDQQYGYAFNAQLSGADIDRVSTGAVMVLVFETRRGWKNAAGGPEALPATPRHDGLDGVAYLDGHAMYSNRGNLIFQPKYLPEQPRLVPPRAARPPQAPPGP